MALMQYGTNGQPTGLFLSGAELAKLQAMATVDRDAYTAAYSYGGVPIYITDYAEMPRRPLLLTFSMFVAKGRVRWSRLVPLGWKWMRDQLGALARRRG